MVEIWSGSSEKGLDILFATGEGMRVSNEPNGGGGDKLHLFLLWVLVQKAVSDLEEKRDKNR